MYTTYETAIILQRYLKKTSYGIFVGKMQEQNK